jgi:hypothetical protein
LEDKILVVHRVREDEEIMGYTSQLKILRHELIVLLSYKFTFTSFIVDVGLYHLRLKPKIISMRKSELIYIFHGTRSTVVIVARTCT